MALRVEAAGAELLAVEPDLLLLELLLLELATLDFAGAVELENTDWPPCLVVPAVAPLTRADVDDLLDALPAELREVDGFVALELWPTRPLVVAEAVRDGAVLGAVLGAVAPAFAVFGVGGACAAGAGAVAPLAAGATGVGALAAGAAEAVEAGGAAGVAGVP